MESFRVCMCLSLLLICMCWTRGENCHVNPECNCSRRNGSYVYCYPTCGSNMPKFSASSVHFRQVTITGTRDIKDIQHSSFQGLITERLAIRNTGISEIACNTWQYLKDTLTYLYLDNNYLTSVPACSLQLLSNLRYLSLGLNDITVIMEDNFKSLTNLQYLYMQNNKITEIRANSFNGLTNLQYLYIQNNKITEIRANSFNGLTNLQYLYIQNNKITEIRSNSFNGLTNLQYLYIQNNKITEIRANSFNDLTSLRILRLDGNQITQLDVSVFRGVAALSTLYLSNNNLSILHAKIFSDLEKLYYLYLDSNNITSVDSTLFQDLTNLRELQLGNNHICRLPDSVFQDNTHLYGLELQGNCLTSLQGNWFPNNSSLNYLYLENNHLTSLSPEDFRNLKKLSRIYLRGNKLTEIDDRIFGVLPNIRQLYLNRNNIHTLHAGAFRDLENLSTLDISENKLERFGPHMCNNCTRLSSLILSHNQISVMDQTSLNGVNGLYYLRLDNNNLSSSSLDPVLKTVRNVEHLDLSNNSLQTVPSALVNTLNPRFQTLNLRHCNLHFVPRDLGNINLASLDLSANNLESFGTTNAPQNLSTNVFPTLNISENYLQSFNIILKSRYLIALYVHLSHNLLQIPITVTGSQRNLLVDLLDLSFNGIQNVTQFPVSYFKSGNTQAQNLCNDSSDLTVNTLNLSRNVISFISPEACLGIVYTLDLSYNQLSVFGELIPSHISSRVRLQQLYISGNNIHQVSPDALVGLDQLYYLDFRFNNIHSLQFTENKLKDAGIGYARFSGNPINCDCSTAWLRNGSISNRIDSARCQSPGSARGYLVYCYPINDCPVQPEVSITDATKEICNKDYAVDLSNLTVTSHESITDVLWTKTGPGKISGYRLELRELNSGRLGKTLLIHQEMSNTTVSNLRFQQSYNVCLSAQLHGKRVSNEICNEVTIGGVETFCAGLDVVIGLSVSLAVSLITAISLVICMLCRRKVSHRTESSPKVGRPQIKQTETTRTNANMYQHEMKANGNQPNNEELYEDLDAGQYENSGLDM